MSIYYIGDVARCTLTFRTVLPDGSQGAITDPTTVTAKVRTPAGAETSYVFGVASELVKDSTGIYHIDVPCLVSGKYVVRGIGTGAVPTGSADHIVRVAETDFASP
jgi:hypothetical protein